MKILVVDDSPEQQEAARLTLGGHELTIVSTAQEAREYLTGQKIDQKKFSQILKENKFPKDYDPREFHAEREDLYRKIERGCRIIIKFDVVLTDLLMPGEKNGMGDQAFSYIGEPVPYGFGIALLALQQGVKKVAIVSMGDHHDHPVLWFTDCITGNVLPGLQIHTHNVGMKSEDFPKVKNPWDKKDWGKALKSLMEE